MKKTIIICLIFCTIVASLFSAENAQPVMQPRKHVGAIIIDPGHGGRDPGAVGRHLINGTEIVVMEKEITLAITRLLRTKLTERFPDIRVILTREDDVLIRLDERVNQANAVSLSAGETAIFVSIHANASLANLRTRGYTFYIDSGTDKNDDSYRMAEKISLAFTNMFGDELPNRGILRESFYTHTHTQMPAVHAEIGFVSNLEDTLLLYTEQGFDRIANALTSGIAEYIESL